MVWQLVGFCLLWALNNNTENQKENICLRIEWPKLLQVQFHFIKKQSGIVYVSAVLLAV